MSDDTVPGQVKCDDDGFTVYGTRNEAGKRMGLKLPLSAWPRLLYALAHPKNRLAREALKQQARQHVSPNAEVQEGSLALRAERWWMQQGYGRLPPLGSETYDGMLRDYGAAASSQHP